MSVQAVCDHLTQQGLRVFITNIKGRYLFRVKNQANQIVAVASNRRIDTALAQLVVKTTPFKTVTTVELS